MKKLGKRGSIIIFTIFILLVISGCNSGPTIIDPSVPLEMSSTLIIRKCAVIEFNGRDTGWNLFDTKWGIMGGDRRVVIPSGTHTLKVFHRSDSGMMMVERTSPLTTFEFLPGRTYLVTMGGTTNRPVAIIREQ